MSESTYALELNFTNDFDDAVIQISSSIHKNDSQFIASIQTSVAMMKNILGLQPGINQMSTFTDYEGTTYKLTLQK